MRGINLRLPYTDSNFEKLSHKTDLLVEQNFSNISTEQDFLSVQDSKQSFNFLRSFSSIVQEIPDKKGNYEFYNKLEEEVKEKNQVIHKLQRTNNELKKLIKQLQDEK